MPSRPTTHVDALLSNAASGVIDENAGLYVAGTVAPITYTPELSGLYPLFDRNAFVQDAAVAIDDGVRIPEIDFTMSTTPYSIQQFGAAARMLYRDLYEVGPGSVNPQVVKNAKLKLIVNTLLLRHEIAFASTYFKTGVWGTDYTGGAAGVPFWDDFTASDPEAAIEAAQETMDLNGGMRGNVLLIGRQVWKWLKRHPRIKPKPGLGSDTVTPEALAKLFGVDRVVVAGAKKATNIQGATAAYSYVFGRSALLVRAAANGSVDSEPSALRIFAWNQIGGPDRPAAVEIFDKPEDRYQKMQVRVGWGHVVQSASLGIFFSNIVSA